MNAFNSRESEGKHLPGDTLPDISTEEII